MKHLVVASLIVAGLSVRVPAQSADAWIERLSLCQDSWLDWKDDPAQTRTLVQRFDAAFSRKPDGGPWVPRATTRIVGLPVVEAFPDSVGMGVGFSVTVAATFATTRGQVEQAAGRPLTHCETGDGLRTCALDLAEQRTLMIMAPEDPKVTATLIGCYYYYAR